MANPKTTISLEIEITDIAVVLLSYDRIQIHRSTSGDGGPYVEITSETTRVKLLTGITEYLYEDTSGEKDYWYKFRYYNSTTLAVAAFSSPVQGSQHPALDIVSVTELKTNYLFGVDLTNDKGEPYPDSLFEHYIKSAVDWLEHFLDLQLTAIDIEEERHDFFRQDYENYIWMELDHFPLYHIEEVKLVLPGDQVVKVFDTSWIHVARESGQLQLIPGLGSAGTILLGAGGSWLPVLAGSNDHIPDAFRVKYSAGFAKPPPGSPVVKHKRYDTVPPKLVEVAAKMASLGPFNIAGDLLGGAGIASQSLGLDGLSMSFNTTSSSTSAGYGARIIQYQKDLKAELPALQRYYKGLKLRVA